MFTALHPLLLWGTAAVSIPILIHLLLRQRPRPLPWAAMRWLLAAAQRAQRRYRLTNLLLLLLRCLIVTLLALAIARPTISGIGGGERLVLIVDRTASMGPRGHEPGPLAIAKAALAHAQLTYHTVAVATVADTFEVLSDGSPASSIEALSHIDASALPGGLDGAASGPRAGQAIGLLGSGADVVLISDFQQDDGTLLTALLKPHCRSLSRWRVGSPCANAVIGGIDHLDDLRPGQPGELVVNISGHTSGAEIAADDSPFLPVSLPASAGKLRISTPPLSAGDHRLRIRLTDDGLVYDNLLDLPVTVRSAVPALAITEHSDLLVAALHADEAALSCSTVRPAQFPTEPLPARGIVALRAEIASSTRLHAWVLAGGILWTDFELLHGDAGLADLVSGLSANGNRAGGGYASGESDLDEFLRLGSRVTVPAVTLPATAEVVLRAGDAPMVVALPAGSGWVIVNLAPLGDAQHTLEALGTTPLWVERVARRYSARLGAPRFWQAGMPAPANTTLRRDGASSVVKAGDPLLLAPGAWQDDQGAVVVVPNIAEGQLERPPTSATVGSLEAALPERPGIDWGLPLAIAALLVACVEGMVAAWAGRAYGA